MPMNWSVITGWSSYVSAIYPAPLDWKVVSKTNITTVPQEPQEAQKHRVRVRIGGNVIRGS